MARIKKTAAETARRVKTAVARVRDEAKALAGKLAKKKGVKRATKAARRAGAAAIAAAAGVAVARRRKRKKRRRWLR